LSYFLYKREKKRIIAPNPDIFQAREEPAMNRFAALSTLIALAASASAPAFAEQAMPAAAPAGAQRVVMLCDSSVATRAAYRRDFGSRPVFVTAEQALRARATGEVWTTPRCMTAREHARLTQTLNSYAAVR